MKILLLTDRMEAGGAETHVALLARELTRAGEDVVLLSSGGAMADALEAEGIRQIRWELCTHNPLRLLFFRGRLKKMIKKEGYEILHAHARIPALLIRGLFPDRCAEIVTVHAHFRKGPLRCRLSNWGRSTVAISEDLRSYVCDAYRVPAERITVIPNGIDCAAFSPSPRKEMRSSLLPLRLLFASRLDADCSLGAELLCRLAPRLKKEFPNLCISIAGGGTEAERIRALAENVNRTLGEELITLPGWVRDMPTLLREQDVFVGVSRAAMEAAACGCAVVLCGNEGYLGILNEEAAPSAVYSNLCARGNPPPSEEALFRDLRLLLSEPTLRLACARAGRQLIETEFNAAQMCQSLLSLYRRARPFRACKTLAIGGYFGCGNLGDDAILTGFLELLHSIAPSIRVRALTGAPRRDRDRFGILCHNRRNPLSICRALGQSDAFLCGGGSLLQNITSRRTLWYYLGLLGMAERCRPTVLCAAGIGPLAGVRAKERVCAVLSRCRYVSLRDDLSLRLLQTMGLSAALLHRGADFALWMPTPPKSRTFALLHEHRLPSHGEFLCVILRDIRAGDLLCRAVSAAVRMLCRHHGLIPLFLAFDVRDERVSLLAAEQTGGTFVRLREAADAAAVLRGSRCVLSMRLHGLILATREGVPAVGISADPRDKKLESFAVSAGQSILPMQSFSVGTLVECAEGALKSRSALRPLLKDCVEEERKKAKKDLENILSMLYNRDK